MTLTHFGTGAVQTARPNNYGDFKFDGLDGQRGAYSIRVEYPGRPAKKLRVEVKEASVVTDVIFL